ncbi:ABC transporter ATP-binding protein [Streptomyces sp. WM6373]|nr:ABC transporter ATP-binding protein [Streptomyces sp. WM6373]KOU65463.1 ABC transporter ATP-binding protein [Streptomyces sp. IGB124]KOU74238.1 ABC transporter ATP-binding protein [Streptomyces sp. XY66]KOU86909.1 ABC transporter ATP-binding protein [Streptomyces sp. XY58]KOV05604.1 ABC transporter ATP-binding protein [Streptomyces sp. XY37]KOV19095.1 ABC transporter ATP-binding protein [Streptomyces sp. XY413]KOV35245.1 ABC transporter ATP-binding protein [Streptomyces sp. H021]KOV47913.
MRELAADRKGQIALVALLALLSTASTLTLPWVVGKLLSTLGGDGLTWWTGLLVALGIGSALAGAGATFLLARLGQRMICRLRVRTMRHTLGMKVSDIRAEGSGNLVARITADTSRIKKLIDAGPIQLPMAALTTVGTLVIMGFIDWVLLLVTLGAFSVAAVLITGVVKGLRRSYISVQEVTSSLAQRYIAATDAVKVIKAYRAEQQVGDDLAEHAENVARREIDAARMEALMMPVITLGQQIALVAVITGGGARMLDGRLSLADFVAFLLYLLQLTAPLMMIASAVTALKMGVVARERFTSLFAMEQEAGDQDRATLPERRPAAPAVEFEDVRFGYGSTPVLRGADFRVPARGLTAMVGLSGSGKTTSLELIERFALADGGSVRVFGRDVTDWPLGDLRRRMAYVDQSATLVQESVRSNLTLGRSATSVSDDDMLRVLDRVGLAEELARTPQGLDTVLAGNVDLSGGQRQRLAIARAMLSESDLVLLDEPSSQLDSVNEQKLRDLVDELARERAMLVVAHRISTVQHADHVIVFDEGRVVGEGQHATLMRDCPVYARLVRGQMLAAEDGTAADADARVLETGARA